MKKRIQKKKKKKKKKRREERKELLAKFSRTLMSFGERAFLSTKN